jgi:hypothetical protein
MALCQRETSAHLLFTGSQDFECFSAISARSTPLDGVLHFFPDGVGEHDRIVFLQGGQDEQSFGGTP